MIQIELYYPKTKEHDCQGRRILRMPDDASDFLRRLHKMKIFPIVNMDREYHSSYLDKSLFIWGVKEPEDLLFDGELIEGWTLSAEKNFIPRILFRADMSYDMDRARDFLTYLVKWRRNIEDDTREFYFSTPKELKRSRDAFEEYRDVLETAV